MRKTPKRENEAPSGPSSSGRDFKALFYRKLTETHLFYEVGRIIASEMEPSELIQKVLAVIKKEVRFDNATVYVVKKDLTGLEPFYCYGPLFRDVTLEPIYFDIGAPGAMAATGEPLFIQDTAVYEGFLHFPDEQERPGSYIGVALKNDSRVVGIMGFSRDGSDAFRVEEFDMIRTLSHLISAGFEKAELFKKTLELARVDELTGLFNYRVLMEKLEDEVRRQVRTGRDFSFIMIDIDDFKRVNDRYGHLEGSRLIAQMGPLLKAACRTTSTDTCFRYGGEEFSVLLAETDLEEAAAVAERVRKAVEEYPFSVKVAHPSEQITVSLGVSTMRADNARPAPMLINEADMALYRSKSSGKNLVTCFSEALCGPAAGPEA
jgi:diguanylate cyclase (GGDEF)-like protein